MKIKKNVSLEEHQRRLQRLRELRSYVLDILDTEREHNKWLKHGENLHHQPLIGLLAVSRVVMHYAQGEIGKQETLSRLVELRLRIPHSSRRTEQQQRNLQEAFQEIESLELSDQQAIARELEWALSSAQTSLDQILKQVQQAAPLESPLDFLTFGETNQVFLELGHLMASNDWMPPAEYKENAADGEQDCPSALKKSS